MATAVIVDELLAEGTVTVKGAEREFGFAKTRLYGWMADGTLPYSQVGAKRLIPRRALKRLVAAGLVGVKDEGAEAAE